jgi:hypothetical protein
MAGRTARSTAEARDAGPHPTAGGRGQKSYREAIGRSSWRYPQLQHRLGGRAPLPSRSHRLLGPARRQPQSPRTSRWASASPDPFGHQPPASPRRSPRSTSPAAASSGALLHPADRLPVDRSKPLRLEGNIEIVTGMWRDEYFSTSETSRSPSAWYPKPVRTPTPWSGWPPRQRGRPPSPARPRPAVVHDHAAHRGMAKAIAQVNNNPLTKVVSNCGRTHLVHCEDRPTSGRTRSGVRGGWCARPRPVLPSTGVPLLQEEVDHLPAAEGPGKESNVPVDAFNNGDAVVSATPRSASRRCATTPTSA